MNGFKYTINGREYNVKFKHYNNRIIRCFLFDYDFDKVFNGKAKLNIPAGDVYNEEHGEQIAFDNAIEKRSNFIKKIKIIFQKEIDLQETVDAKALNLKLGREQKAYASYLTKKERRKIWESISSGKSTTE
jgi:hypothetical protein